MHQIVLGAGIPFLAALIVYIIHRFRAPLWLLIITPPAMLAGAVWAEVPDIPKLVGWYSLYDKLSRDPRSNIFFWHYTIDRIEAARLDSLTWLFDGCFVLLATAVLAAAWRELYLAEKEAQ